jgi:hypothetical protein
MKQRDYLARQQVRLSKNIMMIARNLKLRTENRELRTENLSSLRPMLCAFIFFLSFILNLKAQEYNGKVNMVWGEDLFLESKNIIPSIIGYDSTGYYSLVDDYTWAIEHYDQDLKNARREYLDMNDGLRTREFEALVHFHDTLYLFTSEVRFNSNILYVQSIDKKTLRQNPDERVIIESRDLGGWKADFHIILSRLENKLLVVSRIIIYGRKIQDITFISFGKGLTKEWQSGDRIQHDKKIYSEAEFVTDESGNAYMLCLYYEPVLFQHFNPRKNSYLIVAFTDSGQSVTHYYADFENKYIRGIEIEPALNNDLACAGFYSPSLNDYTVDGLFFFNIDAELKIMKDLKFHELEPYFLEESMELKKGHESKYLYSFYLNHLALRENGNYILAGEQVFEQDFDTYRNIMVISLSPQGDIFWERVINKSQSQEINKYPDYSSYCLFAPSDWNKIIILFNENLKNLNRPEEKEPLNFIYTGKAYLSCVEIGEFGEIGKYTIYTKKRKRMLTPAPLYFYDMKTNEMIMPALRYRKFKFLKLTFY